MPSVHWARRAVRFTSAPRTRRRATLRLSTLEDRTVPATFRWVNPAGGDIATAANWQDDAGNPGVPGPTDDALILTPGITVTSSGATAVRDLTSVAALDVTAGTLTAAAASLTGAVDVAGGTLVVNGASSAADMTLSAGGLGGTGTLAVSGSMTWTGGTVGANLHILSGATLDVGGNGTDTIDGVTLTNDGTVTWDGTGTLAFQHDSAVQNNGTFTDAANHAATFTGGSGESAEFHNAGLYTKNAGPGVSDVGVLFDNTGTLQADVGTLRLSTGVAQDSSGTLSGGTWEVGAGATLDDPSQHFTASTAAITLSGPGANFTSIGGLSQNLTPGVLTLTGGASFTNAFFFFDTGRIAIGPGSTFSVANFDLEAPGKLTFQIAGRPGTGQFGQLADISGSTLNGDLDVALLPGANTQSGDSYTLINSAGIDGTPTGITQDGAGATTVFNVDVGSTALTATAVQNVTDLAVTTVTPPAGTAAPGDTVTIGWTVKNNAAVATSVTAWTDNVYVSTSPTFDSSAVLVAQVPQSGALAGGGTYNGTFSGPLPGVLAGNYYVFVQTDVGQVVPDADRPNNVGTSATTFAVTDPPILTLGAAPVNGSVAAGGDAWYRLDAPGGTPLRVAATFGAAGAGTLAIDYRQYPRAGSALDSDTDPTTLMESVGLPATQGGAYYIQVHGVTGGNFTIQADTPAFVITRLVNTTGGSAGSATLTIHGVGFTPTSTVSLVKGKTTRKAATVLFVSADTVYATFNLKGLAAGTYDVRVTTGSQSVTAVGGYTVNTTKAGQLVYHINNPAVTPPVGQDATATIDITNTGGTDLPTPLLLLFDLGGAGVRLPEDAPPAGGEVWFLPSPADAPAGIIPAGYRGTISVIVTPEIPGSPINLALHQAVAGTPMYWNVFFKDQLQPPGMPAAEWNAVFANFESMVGATSTTYIAALRSAATYLASVGTPVRNADELLGYLVQQAGLSIPGNTLDQVTDASFPSPGLALDFTRSFPTSVAGQYRQGRLGDGWVDNWDISVLSATGGPPPTDGTDVFLNEMGAEREFAPTDSTNTTYKPVYGGEDDVLTFDGTRFIETADDGTITAFRTDGQLDYMQDPGGTRVTAAYDGSGRLMTLTHSDGRAIAVTWNTAGQIATVTDPAGRVTTFAYKGQQLVSATGVLGVEKYTYKQDALASITPPGGPTTAFTYDKFHRVTSRSTGKTEAVKYTYGIGGSVTATDAAGGKTTILSNADGVIAAVRGGSGPDLQLSYDSNGLATRIATSAGQVWTTTRDDDGNPTAETDPLGNTVTRTFQGDDVTGVTDARGNTTAFQPDAAGDALAITYPDSSSESFVYDPTGSLVETINRDGNAVQYLTNADGQVVRRIFADGTHTDYTYDAHGNLTGAADAAGTTTLAYLPNDLLQQITYPDGRFLKFSYNAASQRASSVDQDGFTINYAYDKAGRLAELLDGTGAMIVKYTYDKAGRLTEKSNANGTFTTDVYDIAGRVLSLVNHQNAKTVNTEFDYTYDAAGNVATMTTAGVTTTYGYDADGQLISVVTPTDTTTYTYDAAGNRTSETDNGVTTNYTVNNLNEVTTAGSTTYGYDLDGNRTSMTDASGTTTYTWNDLDQLTGVTSPTDTFAYTYDGLDQLFQTTQNGQTTTNLNDPFGLGSVAAQYNAGGLIAHYVTGVGLETRVAADGSKAFYDFDQTGNVIGLMSPAGSYVNKYSYQPFGQTTTIAAGLANPFTYAGQWGVSTDGNGLFNMRARNFDPSAGGFVSDDPTGFAGGDFNIRRYAANDPIDLVDPTGLSCDNDQLQKLQSDLDKAQSTLDEARSDLILSETFQDSSLYRLFLLGGNTALFMQELSRNAEDFEDLRDKVKRDKSAVESAQYGLNDCKRQLPVDILQPQYTITTPNGLPHAGGGLKIAPVSLN